MNELLTHGEKQVIKYAKGHFQQTNLIDDLRTITAVNFEIPIEHTYFYHAYEFVTGVFIKLQENKYITVSMDQFLSELFKWKQALTPEDMMEQLLSRISIVPAAGLNLGEADEKYLPRRKSRIYREGIEKTEEGISNGL